MVMRIYPFCYSEPQLSNSQIFSFVTHQWQNIDCIDFLNDGFITYA